MAQLQDTAGDLRRVANFFKGVTAAADVIERLGSLENATNEAKSDLAKAEVARDGMIQAHKDIQAKCKALLAETKEEAGKLMGDAVAEATALAADLLAKAEGEAAKFMEEARRQSGDMSAKAAAAAQKWEQTVADLTTQSATLTAAVSDLESKRALAQAEFDKLNKAVDKIKSQFKIE